MSDSYIQVVSGTTRSIFQAKHWPGAFVKFKQSIISKTSSALLIWIGQDQHVTLQVSADGIMEAYGRCDAIEQYCPVGTVAYAQANTSSLIRAMEEFRTNPRISRLKINCLKYGQTLSLDKRPNGLNLIGTNIPRRLMYEVTAYQEVTQHFQPNLASECDF